MEENKLIDNYIELKNVGKIFKNDKTENNVIGSIDLSVKANEFLVICGPGQCGKTTLINVIAGLTDYTSGTITVNGKTVSGPGPDRGIVFQTTALFPWLTVMGNVEFGLKAQGMAKAKRRKISQYYIDLVGLTGFEKSFPSQLSGGMQQRVGIARAYAINPDVMLLDEPFGHLDAQTRYMMEEELIKIWQKEKRTVIFVTNNIEEAVYLADRVLLLKNCPTSISKEYVIDLPRPRNYVDPDFLALRQEITDVMDKTL